MLLEMFTISASKLHLIIYSVTVNCRTMLFEHYVMQVV